MPCCLHHDNKAPRHEGAWFVLVHIAPRHEDESFSAVYIMTLVAEARRRMVCARPYRAEARRSRSRIMPCCLHHDNKAPRHEGAWFVLVHIAPRHEDESFSAVYIMTLVAEARRRMVCAHPYRAKA